MFAALEAGKTGREELSFSLWCRFSELFNAGGERGAFRSGWFAQE